MATATAQAVKITQADFDAEMKRRAVDRASRPQVSEAEERAQIIGGAR